MSGESHDVIVKIMILIVLSVSVIDFTLAGYAILLREENKKYDLIIEEIRSSVLPGLSGEASPIELPPVVQGVTEVPRDVQKIPVEQHFFLETFDYRKLILNSFDFLVEGSGFSF
ncbi:MAG TPA: sporulation protein, partial [Mesotoga infera]|nr:sporulation protein [Mesotoga infera]